ncbi:MAG: hypothetical protein ABIS03_04965, partial [Gemmatimonadaceae bacterium]
MRFIHSSVLAVIGGVSLLSTSMLEAQRRAPRMWEAPLSRFSLEGDLLVAQPKGEFATQIDTNGYGGNIGA